MVTLILTCAEYAWLSVIIKIRNGNVIFPIF